MKATIERMGEVHARRHKELYDMLREVLAMLDASSFGGHKTYRCLTPMELERLKQIRILSGIGTE